MNGLDLRALEIFRAVASEGSVSKAAQKLNRVQSNVSTRVKQLEEQLGIVLFERQGRGLALTSEGRLLLSYAEQLHELSAETVEALKDGKPRGTFRLGTMESTAAARLPAILSRYHVQYPDVDFVLQTATAAALIESLLSYEIEAAFLAEPVNVGRIETMPVFKERLVLVAPSTYPPLKRIAEISGRTMIAFEEGCAYRRYLQDWLLETGIVPGGVVVVNSYLAILACVTAGTGFAVVPQSVLDVVSTEGQFRFYPLPGKLARITTLLAWRTNHHSSRLEALKELLPGHR